MPSLVTISRRLEEAVSKLPVQKPVEVVYSPAVYARIPHEKYLKKYGRKPCEALLVGMNPGPWGMGQTGVPFGAVDYVRDFMGITGRVDQPARLHPKRPVNGFDCSRREASGERLWGWAQKRFKDADAFFSRFFVWNCCPLLFYDRDGKNLTPDRLPAGWRADLLPLCDRALADIIIELQPGYLIGIGNFAWERSQAARELAADRLKNKSIRVEKILHPSPANPAANRGWAAQAEKQLKAMGLKLP